MKLAYSLMLVGESNDELHALVRDAESAGFQRVWVPDFYQSVFVVSALIAGSTTKLGVATGMANAFTRSPFETAVCSLDLNRALNGRFVLGLGPGRPEKNLRLHGMDFPHPAPRIEECVRVLRGLMDGLTSGAGFAHKGRFFELNVAPRHGDPGWAPGVPIHLSALGSRMSEVAGRVADGILGHVLGSPVWLRESVWPAVRKGQAAAGRDGSPFEMTSSFICAISSDRAQARRDTAHALSVYLPMVTSAPALRAHGFESIALRAVETPRDQLVDLVTDDLIDTFCAVGSADEVRRATLRFEDTVTGVRVIPPPHGISGEQTAEYQRALIDAFGA